MRHLTRDALLVAPMVVIVWLGFGWPDVNGALGLLHAGDPSRAQITAGVGLLVWSVVGILSVVLAVQLVRASGPWVRSLLVVALGLVVLTIGIVVHEDRGYRMCCGSMQSAEQALRDGP